MKVIKDKDQALLFNVFGFRGKYYLVCSALVCFDLINPTALLPEKEMWECVKQELGQGQVLDASMPKPKGEVLLIGSCHAPRGRERPAARVSFRVGEIHKALNVYGARHWTGSGEMMSGITDPEPFIRIPITYQRAFGGAGFERNPVGMGAGPVATPSGETIHSLPQIEDPDHLIGSPEDRSEPVGFGPYDITWPQRAHKAGTYDDKWLKERWPFYPDDLDVTFFNTAPDDQQIDGYFRGDETIEIENMHPEEQLIQSRLPGVRVRCFLTQLETPKSKPDETVFKELKTKLDTVWLFSSALKGVALFRGEGEVVDDEFSNARIIFLAAEDVDEEPKSLEHYREEQERRLDRTVKIDQTAVEEAKKKIAAALARIKEVPNKIEEMKARVFGKASPLAPTSVGEKAARGQGNITSALARLDRMEALVTTMKAKHGHLVDIDAGGIGKARQKLTALSKKLAQVQAAAEKKLAQAAEARKGFQADLKAAADKLQPMGIEVDPDRPILGAPEKRWKKRGFSFISQCRHNLERNVDAVNPLQTLGLRKRTIRKAFLGLNPEKRMEDPVAWGLPVNPDEEHGILEIPAGLIVPRFTGPVVDKIKVRPGDFLDSAEDEIVPGSNEAPLALGLEEGKPICRAADELDALLVFQEAGDLCGVVAIKDPAVQPDDETAKILETAPAFLALVPAGEAAGREWAAWTEAYPAAIRVELPKENRPIKARKAEVDLRALIRQALPPAVLKKLPEEEPEVTADDIKPGAVALPKMDVKGMVQGFMKEAAALTGQKKALAMKEKKSMLAAAREGLGKLGLDPEKVMTRGSAMPKGPFDPSDMTAALERQRSNLKSLGRLTPEMDQKIQENISKIKRVTQGASARQQAGQARLEAAKAKLADPIPKWAKAKREQAGRDPETGAPLSRETVIEYYRQGKRFTGMDLSGLDLSQLDLHGINLAQAICRGTKFNETNLEGPISLDPFAMKRISRKPLFVRPP